MKVKPKTYTLALMREGVTQFLKEIQTFEQLEKLTGQKMQEVEEDSVEKTRQEFLAKAKEAILKKQEGDKEEFDKSFKQYLEYQKLQKAAN